MLEKTMRQLVKDLCSELDETIKTSMRKVVLPAALGAGLALSLGACGEATDEPDPNSGKEDPGYVHLYGNPFPEVDAGPTLKYMGPFLDAGSPTLKYMGPFMDAGIGPQPKYMGPFMDGGEPIISLYAVPFPEDGGATPKYMGPFPDDE